MHARGPSRAISHARGHLRVSRFARRTTEKRETARSLIAVRIRTCRAIFFFFLLRQKKPFRTVFKLTSGSAFPVFIITQRHNTQSNSFSLKTVGDVQFWNIKLPLNYKEICLEVIQGQITEASDWNQPNKDFTCILICCSCIRRCVWALSLAKKFKNKNIDKDKDYQTVV